MSTAAAALAPTITVICPACAMPLRFTLALGEHGCDPRSLELGRAGIRLHVRVGCEAT